MNYFLENTTLKLIKEVNEYIQVNTYKRSVNYA